MIGVIIGTRPHIPKVYSLIKALRARDIPHIILHTNQHYDFHMQQLLFGEFGYTADVVMDKYSIGAAIDWTLEMIRKFDIKFLFTQGDSSPALVGAIAGVYSDIGIAHMEAGLRSYDPEMYEERNRLMVDDASHYLFTYTDTQAQYLAELNHLRGKAFSVGNPTVDVINDFAHKIVRPRTNDYIFVTLHRKELTDNCQRIICVFRALRKCTEELGIDLVFPIHPRTQKALEIYNISAEDILGSRAIICQPTGFFESLSYQRYARAVVTDSGCIQEEACILNVPCVTVRENTERHETINLGCNVLTGFNENDIFNNVVRAVKWEGKWDHPYGEPGVGGRTLDIVLRNFIDYKNY